jgi:hypothetical protein
MSAVINVSTMPGTRRAVGSLTSCPAMSARAKRPARVSALASHAAMKDEASGVSSGTSTTVSRSALVEPPPAHASSAMARACQSRKRSGDGSPSTGTRDCPDAWSTTATPTDASRSMVAATWSSPNVVARMALTASAAAWSVGRTSGPASGCRRSMDAPTTGEGGGLWAPPGRVVARSRRAMRVMTGRPTRTTFLGERGS